MDHSLLVDEVPTTKKFWQRNKVSVSAAFLLTAASVPAYIGYQHSARFIPAPAILFDRVSPEENVPYIIRNKANSQGLMNAELSWDGGSPHPMASVEFHDPVDWRFQRSGGGYRIINMANVQGQLNNQLSWDGFQSRHARASVQCCDPVDWGLRRSGPYWRIINLANQQGLYHAELSWDGVSRGTKAMASVEFNDPVDWEIVPSYTVSGHWMRNQVVNAAAGTLATVSTTWGVQHETSWSQTSTFSSEIIATISAPLGAGGGMTMATVTATASPSLATWVGEVLTTSPGETIEQAFPSGYLWQWRITVRNNHYDGGTIVTDTNELALTSNSSETPKCAPGFCMPGSFCQTCFSYGDLSR